MSEMIAPPPVETSEQIGISEADYMEHWAEQRYEWAKGVLFTMTPISSEHDVLIRYSSNMLEAYFEFRPIGRIRRDPFVMRLEGISSRQPDIQVILHSNPHPLKPTYMDGPADICIEITSPGSVKTDRGDKFVEYEKGGVGEYWIFDPQRRESLFYRLNASGVYQSQPLENDTYATPLLPGLKIHVPTLWLPEGEIPGVVTVVKMVEAMLNS